VTTLTHVDFYMDDGNKVYRVLTNPQRAMLNKTEDYQLFAKPYLDRNENM